MIKIIVRNDKLYLDRTGKETRLESVKIYSDKSKGTYKIVVFPQVVTKSIRSGQEFTQKTYPLVSIALKKVEEKHITTGKPYYYLKTKDFYINYYTI